MTGVYYLVRVLACTIIVATYRYYTSTCTSTGSVLPIQDRSTVDDTRALSGQCEGQGVCKVCARLVQCEGQCEGQGWGNVRSNARVL